MIKGIGYKKFRKGHQMTIGMGRPLYCKLAAGAWEQGQNCCNCSLHAKGKRTDCEGNSYQPGYNTTGTYNRIKAIHEAGWKPKQFLEYDGDSVRVCLSISSPEGVVLVTGKSQALEIEHPDLDQLGEAVEDAIAKWTKKFNLGF